MFEELERRTAEIERHRENGGRLAAVFARFETTGQGSFEFEERIEFELTFIEEPTMAFGAVCDIDDLCELLLIEPEDNITPPLPVVSGMVTNWDQDENDMYIGAWVAVNVYFPPVGEILVPVEVLPVVRHHFTFGGNAIKDIPIDERD